MKLSATPRTVRPVQQQQPQPTEAPKPQGIKRIDLGGINKAVNKPTSATKYPTFPESPDAKALAEYIVENEDVPDVLKAKKGELAGLVTPFYFNHCAGKQDIPSSVLVMSDQGPVRVTFPNKYSTLGVTETKLLALLPEPGKYFRQKIGFKVDGDKIPEQNISEIVLGLQELFAQHGCSDALTVSEAFVPVPDFHERRHRELPTDVNIAMQTVARCTVTISGKNVRL